VNPFADMSAKHILGGGPPSERRNGIAEVAGLTPVAAPIFLDAVVHFLRCGPKRSERCWNWENIADPWTPSFEKAPHRSKAA
jgi:hypothetical protein